MSLCLIIQRLLLRKVVGLRDVPLNVLHHMLGTLTAPGSCIQPGERVGRGEGGGGGGGGGRGGRVEGGGGERVERGERGEGGERGERGERVEGGERVERGERREGGERVGREGNWRRSHRPSQHTPVCHMPKQRRLDMVT